MSFAKDEGTTLENPKTVEASVKESEEFLMKSKFLPIVASLVLIVSLAACSNSESSSEPLTGDLLIWDTGLLGRSPLESGEVDPKSFLDSMAIAFEEANPGANVTIVQQGGDISTNTAQYQAATIAGTGPDIRVQFAGAPTISFDEFFTDLAPLLNKEILDSMTGWNVNRADFDPAGRILGMPYGAGSLFTVFQNHKVLKEAGLDPANHPKTWEELLENGRIIQSKTKKEAFWVANLEGYVGAWFIAAMVGGELGANAFTEMFKGRVPVDHPAMVKAYQAFADWGKSGLTNKDAGQVSNGQSFAGYVKGNSAYYLVGSWENSLMREAFGDNASSFFIPVLKGAKYPNIGAGGPEIAISISEKSKKKDLAGAFLRFLAQAKNQDRFVEIYQTQASNHKDGDPSKILNPLLQEQFRHLTKATDGLTFAFDSVMPSATIDLFYRVNAGVFLGSISPKDAVAQLKASWEQETQK